MSWQRHSRGGRSLAAAPAAVLEPEAVALRESARPVVGEAFVRVRPDAAASPSFEDTLDALFAVYERAVDAITNAYKEGLQ